MLQSFYGIIQVKHYQNGRLRLQTEILKDNEELKEEFLHNIRRISGINSTKVNSITGSILIYFDEKVIEGSFLYLVVLKLLYLDEEALKNKSGKIKELLKQVFESTDMAIYNKSKGYLDLKTLTALFFMELKNCGKFQDCLKGLHCYGGLPDFYQMRKENKRQKIEREKEC